MHGWSYMTTRAPDDARRDSSLQHRGSCSGTINLSPQAEAFATRVCVCVSVCVLAQAQCSLRAIETTSATHWHRRRTHDTGLLDFEQVCAVAVAGTVTADCFPVCQHMYTHTHRNEHAQAPQTTTATAYSWLLQHTCVCTIKCNDPR